MPKLQVPVTKGKGFVEIDTDAIPEDVFREIVLQGLKVLVNRGTSKITSTTYPNADELKAAAMAKAEEQVQLILTSKIKFTGGKKKGAGGAVMVEARRLAKNLVKDTLKKAGHKISHYPASEITKAANALLENPDVGPGLMKKAEEAVAERNAASVPEAIDIAALIQTDPKLVAAAEAKKAKPKAEGQLSAKQAGKAAPRKKGQGKGAPAQA